jgi:2-C-methyl-D-erythritol 4-phosphate cytidylyltransferase/2-C-methyl-D-erythritol 2,4-cyclodiphosphate synthase
VKPITKSTNRISRYAAVIPAAGLGVRFGGDRPKQYMRLNGRPILYHVIDFFARQAACAHIVLVLHPTDSYFDIACLPDGLSIEVVTADQARMDSVFSGLSALASTLEPESWVLIHDAARPLLQQSAVDRLCTALYDHPIGGLLGLPVADTLKAADVHGVVSHTVDRTGLYQAQTPQLFRYGLLYRAMKEAISAGREVTDEAAALEAMGYSPQLVAGDSKHGKVTHPADWSQLCHWAAEPALPLRVGLGYDAHRFTRGNQVMLGGIAIPHTHGILAHSDGDVVLHALGDALLGAAGLGDLGTHFPDTDVRWKGAAGADLVASILAMLKAAGYLPKQVDVTVIAESPKLSPHRVAMQANIARMLALPIDQVNIKATTLEGMGWEGRAEGLAAHCLTTIQAVSS